MDNGQILSADGWRNPRPASGSDQAIGAEPDRSANDLRGSDLRSLQAPPDPKHQVIRITSFFAGIAYGGAATEGHGGDAVIDTSAVTAVMEPITRLAEHGLLRA